MFVCVYTHTHVYIYKHICVCTHTHIHTHTLDAYAQKQNSRTRKLPWKLKSIIYNRFYRIYIFPQRGKRILISLFTM